MGKEFKKFKLNKFNSKGYELTPVELKDSVPFTVKRLYFIDLPSDIMTGEHCHKVEEEVFMVMKGEAVAVIDKGQGKEDIKISAGDALYVPAFVWHGFKDSDGKCMILALSSTNYSADRKDYIEDYEEFLDIRK